MTSEGILQYNNQSVVWTKSKIFRCRDLASKYQSTKKKKQNCSSNRKHLFNIKILPVVALKCVKGPYHLGPCKVSSMSTLVYFPRDCSWKSLSTQVTLVGCMHAHVSLYHTACAKAFVTHRAVIRSLFHVGYSVCSQSACLPEAFSTELAFERTVSRVNTCMRLQPAWGTKTFATDWTHVRFHSGVNSLMSSQAWLLHKPPPTHWTGIWFFTRMHTSVTHQPVRAPECLSTDRASMRLLLLHAVNSLMLFQIQLGFKPSSTHRAWVTPLPAISNWDRASLSGGGLQTADSG